jgi:hypothetical protein
VTTGIFCLVLTQGGAALVQANGELPWRGYNTWDSTGQAAHCRLIAKLSIAPSEEWEPLPGTDGRWYAVHRVPVNWMLPDGYGWLPLDALELPANVLEVASFLGAWTRMS